MRVPRRGPGGAAGPASGDVLFFMWSGRRFLVLPLSTVQGVLALERGFLCCCVENGTFKR